MPEPLDPSSEPTPQSVDPTKSNTKVIRDIELRAAKPDAVLGPCLREYQNRVTTVADPLQLLENLTGPLVAVSLETRALIEANMRARWPDTPERVQSSVINSLRRSAGTNYQSLLTYALARYFVATASAWYVQKPMPADLKESLAITFTAGVTTKSRDEEVGDDHSADFSSDADNWEGVSEEANDDEAQQGPVTVKPDVDIVLRNAAWSRQAGGEEPIVLLSVKTSLVDRAGMAARWKTYFDLVTRPCPHQSEEDCAYRRLGITMANSELFNIQHGIVTANIYKLNFHDRRYRRGELASGQTQSNTYMFDLKLTTRDDEEAYTPPDWSQFPRIVEVLNNISAANGLPR